MSEEKNKPNDDLSREEINEELDKLKDDKMPEMDNSGWTCYVIALPSKDDKDKDDDYVISLPPIPPVDIVD